VVIASRNLTASEEAAEALRREHGPEAALALALDLGSLAAVRAFADEVDRRDLPLRAVVCNAGLQLNQEQRSPDGVELTVAVNHLGHFLLVQRMLERLKRRAPTRVVVVSSGVHDPALWTGMPKPAMDDLEALFAHGGTHDGAYNGQRAYVNSKVCNMLFVHELVRRLGEGSGVTVLGFDPGLVPGSGLAREYPPALRFVWDKVLPAAASAITHLTPRVNPAWKSGQALARLVTDPALEGLSGQYFPSHTRWTAAPSSRDSQDPARQRALWALSEARTLSGTGEATARA
jgi:NAD(P)-dependent dehydrogenase (short-subunit alcohol dehydrogenase family)